MKTKGIARRFLKIIVVLAGTALVLVAALAGYVGFLPLPRYPSGAGAEMVEVTPERVRQGKRIASMRCLDCHVDPKTGLATGRHLSAIPGIMGVSRSTNITADKNNGIGAWTDTELIYALRTGVARDGRLLPPWMPRLRRMADEDLRALIAFLRSDEPAFRATPASGQRSEWSLLGRALFHFVWKPAPLPTNPIEAPERSDRVAYGKYIVQDLAECWTCHSGDPAKLNHAHPESTTGYLAGGAKLGDEAGSPVLSTNITPDDSTGIGRWSESDFVRVVREGVRPDGTPPRYPMLPYAELSEDEVRAVFAYLRTVPPIIAVPPVRHEQKSGAPPGSTRGAVLYAK